MELSSVGLVTVLKSPPMIIFDVEKSCSDVKKL